MTEEITITTAEYESLLRDRKILRVIAAAAEGLTGELLDDSYMAEIVEFFEDLAMLTKKTANAQR